MLQKVVFDHERDTNKPLLRLNLTSPTEYSLLKRDTNSYVLSLPSVTLAGPHLALPYFPPQDFLGLSAVAPRQTPTGVEILLYIDAATRLVAFANEGDVFVRAEGR